MSYISKKKIRIVSLISRDWSYKITNKLISRFKNIDFHIFLKKNIKNFTSNKSNIIKLNKLTKKHINKIKLISPNLILTFGWSEYFSKELRNIAPCLILHPSKLPKYRGGSPIQNQLIDGVRESAVTILYAEDKLDTGNILYQSKISLDGYLNEILDRMIDKGIEGSIKIIKSLKKNALKSRVQNHQEATLYYRRNPSQSQINLKDFKNHEARYFYNLVRGLQEPYPVAYIKCKNNTKLYLDKVSFKKK